MEILNQIVAILVGGIEGVAGGIGKGMSTLVKELFLTGAGDTTALSTFGTVIIVFAGISLALGLCRWVVNFLTSLGSRNA